MTEPDTVPDREFLALFDEHAGGLYRYAVTLAGRTADADELYQQTCLTLWQTWQDSIRAESFGAWARGIATNHARNLYRKRKRTPQPLDGPLLERVAAARERISDVVELRHAALESCMEQLSDEPRELLTRYHSGEASVAELASTRGRSIDAIYKQLGRLRNALAECVTRNLRQAEATR